MLARHGDDPVAHGDRRRHQADEAEQAAAASADHADDADGLGHGDRDAAQRRLVHGASNLSAQGAIA